MSPFLGTCRLTTGYRRPVKSSNGPVVAPHPPPISPNQQTPFANRICLTDRQSGPSNRGEPTGTTTHFARDVTTLVRLGLNRNSMPRGASSTLRVAVE